MWARRDSRDPRRSATSVVGQRGAHDRGSLACGADAQVDASETQEKEGRVVGAHRPRGERRVRSEPRSCEGESRGGVTGGVKAVVSNLDEAWRLRSRRRPRPRRSDNSDHASAAGRLASSRRSLARERRDHVDAAGRSARRIFRHLGRPNRPCRRAREVSSRGHDGFRGPAHVISRSLHGLADRLHGLARQRATLRAR